MMSFANLIHVDRANLQVGKQVACGRFASAGVFAAGPKWSGAAIGVADAEVVEIDRERAGRAASEDDAVLSQRTGCGAAEADDAVFPDTLAVGDAGASDLIAAELINSGASFEERSKRF